MASSASYNFTVTRDDLIKDALLHIGAIAEGETPSSDAIANAARILNMLVKLRQAQGMPLWAIRRGIILPFSGASSINTNSHVVTFYDTTTLSANAASAASTINITAAGTIAIADVIGIELDSGDIQYTTVTDIIGTTVTLTDVLTGDAAAGNRIYAYTASTDRVQRPLQILYANNLRISDNTSWEIRIDELKDYWNLSNRTSEGTPICIAYEAVLGLRSTSPDTSFGTIYVYPRFLNGDIVIEFTYLEPAQDFDVSSDNPYWSQEFYLPLWLELAALLGPRYGLEADERRALFNEAKTYFDEAMDTIQTGSIFIKPDMRKN